MAWGSKTPSETELLKDASRHLERAGFSVSEDVLNGNHTKVFRSQTRPTLFIHDFAGGINILAFVKLNKEKANLDQRGLLAALNEMNSKTIALIVSTNDERLILSHWIGSYSKDGFEAFIGCFDHDMEQFVKTSMVKFTA